MDALSNFGPTGILTLLRVRELSDLTLRSVNELPDLTLRCAYEHSDLTLLCVDELSDFEPTVILTQLFVNENGDGNLGFGSLNFVS